MQAAPGIATTVSIYMNFVRWIAASAVVLFHLRHFGFGSPALNANLPDHGKAYVMTFFVISGFVIEHTITTRKHLGPINFAIDRAARIYSVALPVLIFCFVLSKLRPDLDPGDPAIRFPGLYLFLDLSFLCNIWSFEYYPFLNGPYWSLAYEVSYYVIFAIWSFWKGWRRWILLSIAVAIVGPRTLLLFPPWLFGVAAYKYKTAFRMTPTAGWIIAIGSLALLFTFILLGVGQKAKQLSVALASGSDLKNSAAFLQDWLVAAAFALHLYGVCQISLRSSRPVRAISAALADMSFSLYLLHMPMIVWVGSDMPRGENWPILLIVPTIISVSYLFSLLTEHQRHHLKSIIRRLARKDPNSSNIEERLQLPP
jgi:peptidoglycan/LPS O-acetylase OafA/YrhL